jgi:heme-degrading monooxygenase HmoA
VSRVPPTVGQVVTVFRNRLADDVEVREAYADELSVIADLARSMPGFVETKTFVADDGERCTVVTFADAGSHRAWRDHPRHRTAQRNGIATYYAEYSIAVGETSYASSFTRPPAPPAPPAGRSPAGP